MSKKWKIGITIVLIIITFAASYIYVLFNGLPWKKASVAKELEAYLEEKYDQKFILKQAHYNFKDSTYFAYFNPKHDPTIEFFAEEGFDEHAYIDVYPEKMWASQLKKDLQPFIENNYPEIDSYDTNYLTYESLDSEIGPEIPRYDEVNATVDANFILKQHFFDSSEQWKLIATITDKVQSKSDNSEVTFNFIDKEKEVDTFLICPAKSEHHIQTGEMAKEMCSINTFDLID